MEWATGDNANVNKSQMEGYQALWMKTFVSAIANMHIILLEYSVVGLVVRDQGVVGMGT